MCGVKFASAVSNCTTGMHIATQIFDIGENDEAINEGIKDVEGITPTHEAPDCRHVYHLYTICVEEEILGASRDDFMRVLYREEGVQGILHYQPTYHFTGLKKLGIYADNECPVAEKFFYKRELNLPMHPRLTKQQQDLIAEGIKNAAKKVRK